MTKTIERSDSIEAQETGTSSWVRLARWGGVAIGVWAILLHLMAGEFIPPVAGIGTVFVVLAVFLKGDRRRLAAVSAVLAVVALVGNLPLTLDELANPSSTPAFVLTLLVTMSALVVVAAGLGAFFRWSASNVQVVAISGAAIFGAGIVVSLVSSAGVASETAMATDAQVVARGVEFTQEEIVVSAGAVGVWVDNQDGIRHSFSVTELGVDLNVPALKAQRVEFDADPGEYVVFCNVPGHEAMTASLIVEG
jgi:plastocyanin